MERKLLAIYGLLIGIALCLFVSTLALVAVPDEWLALVLPIPTPEPLLVLDDEPEDSPIPAQDTPTPEPTITPPATPTTIVEAQTVQAPPTNTRPAPSVTPSATAAPPTPTIASAPVNFVNEILAPLVREARRRRAERESREPQAYARRIDKTLNQNRINFLLFGYGTTYEPPLPPQYKGSIAIYSLDLRTLQISTVTLNHDIRAPEIERYIRGTGRNPQPTKIHWAYKTGGFDLMRYTVEEATGLSVDFQLAFRDSVVKNVVDDGFGGLSVNVPFAFDAEAIYFENVKYPVKHYARGQQTMNGMQALQFIKAIQSSPYDTGKELAIRKQIVVQAALDRLKRETTNPLFWAKLLTFLKVTLERKDVEYDFDAPALLFRSLGVYVRNANRGQPLRLSLGKSLYVVDPGIGDGGVTWVMGSPNPIMINDLKNGVYDADKYFSVPLGNSNPYAVDLVADYWPSVRQLIRQRLTR